MSKAVFPTWLRKRASHSPRVQELRQLLAGQELRTVCQDARCPNMGECFAGGTATFMILGDKCTRGCAFCAVTAGTPGPPDPGEPRRVARAAANLSLNHVVVTSVTRDDLPDGGAGHFAATVREIRNVLPGSTIEILTPDFGGSPEAVDQAAASGPDVYNHNLETVPRLYPRVRPGADYRRSLSLLARVKDKHPGMLTKSGLMVGLGEEPDELAGVLQDLREAGCDLLTIGQYLQPGPGQLPVQQLVEPDQYRQYQRQGLALGFREVAAGPFVRSSYRAHEMVVGHR
ncbi:MAG: lipoyl synthase [Bacillota bacterium]